MTLGKITRTYIRLSIIILLYLLLEGSVSYAQNTIKVDTTDNLTIYFRFDKADVDSGYMSNGKVLKQLDTKLNKQSTYSQIDSIIITSFTSPEGYKGHNYKLGKKRAIYLKGYLVWKYPHINQYLIKTNYGGENWQGLRLMVDYDNQIPNKKEVLKILDMVSDTEKENLLRQINNGESWSYIERKFLRFLRTGATCVISYKTLPTTDITEDKIFIETQRNEITTDSLKAQVKETVFETTSNTTPIIKSKPLVAIKTNLLADAMTSLNVEIEVPIGKRWSVGAEWMFPWWIFDNNKYYNQLLLGTVEGRYWFHTKRQTEVLSGHALGLYASAGYYDFQWEKNGYQGEILPSVGLSYTYAHKVGKHFRMEYSVGVGVLNTKYRKYTANDQYNQFPWLSSGRTIWVGPTKAEISFVWLISKQVRNEK